MMGFLEAAWHFLFGWPSVTILIGAAATAVAILEPKQLDAITDLRKWAVITAVVMFSLTAIMGKYYNDGLNEIRAQVDAGLVREATQGEAARDDAVHTVDAAGPGGLRNDRWNRDVQRGKSAVGK